MITIIVDRVTRRWTEDGGWECGLACDRVAIDRGEGPQTVVDVAFTPSVELIARAISRALELVGEEATIVDRRRPAPAKRSVRQRAGQGFARKQ